MKPHEILETALKETGLPVAEEKYYGSNNRYIVYNEADQIPSFYVDNAPVNLSFKAPRRG